MKDNNMIRAISENGGMVVCALDATDMVQRMEQLHQSSAVVTAALGRLLTAASLMGSWLKGEDDNLTLRLDGGGPAGPLVAVSDGLGNVRGYATHPVVELPLRADGKLNVGAAVGHQGTLAVIRDMGLKEPYIGQTPLVSGEVAEDITAYYAASEQTPTVCALGVLVNKDLTVRRAGGYLLQLLPGATGEEIDRIEKNVAAIPPVTDLLEQGGTPTDMVQLALKGFAPQVLEARRVEYQCRCSEEKSRDILTSLGTAELEDMLRDGPTAEIQCHFCTRKYTFDLAGLLAGCRHGQAREK